MKTLTFEQQMAEHSKALQAAQDLMIKRFTDAGVTIKQKGYMGENILIMDFAPKDYLKATMLANQIQAEQEFKERGDKVQVKSFDKPKRVTIIF
jgi:DNA-binding transcriptional regulator of glucitol operon